MTSLKATAGNDCKVEFARDPWRNVEMVSRLGAITDSSESERGYKCSLAMHTRRLGADQSSRDELIMSWVVVMYMKS
jgi:hypothetical protein